MIQNVALESVRETGTTAAVTVHDLHKVSKSEVAVQRQLDSEKRKIYV